MSLHHSIAQKLPDLPRWVEARSLLFREDCEISVFKRNWICRWFYVIRTRDLIFVISRPIKEAFEDAVETERMRG